MPQVAGLPGAKLRWRIGGLLGIGVLVNYFDRISLAVAGPQLQAELGLSAVQMGFLLSAFFWSYALLQIPAGMLLDRFGVTRIGRWGALLWAAASTLAACSVGFLSLLIARVLLGVAEAPGFPSNSKATGYWFPRNERALSTALFDAAAKFSNVVGVPLVAVAATTLGWRWGFALVGALSFLYFVAFWRLYRDPSRHPRLTTEERQYLQSNGAVSETSAPPTPGGMLAHLLRNQKVWGLTIGFSAYGYCFYFFMTWLPGYLVQSLKMSILQSAGTAAIPWMCATVSDLVVGGWLIDRLVARGGDESRVRKSVLITGMACGLAVFGAIWSPQPWMAIVWISIALSGLSAAAPVGWSLPSLIAPKGGAATVGGIMNFGNNLMGAAAPIVTGVVIARTHSFDAAFAIAGIVLLVGLASFAFLMGRIEMLPDTHTRR